MALFSKIRKSLIKNLPEISAFATGRMPQFIYGKKDFSDIPVFCFHAVEPARFERQLRFLKENGYATLDTRELDARRKDPAYRNRGKEIVLTFDDGLESLWSVAHPMLGKYGFKAVAFILPGMISEDGAGAPGLCTWPQIRAMHAEGTVDFQSHGMTHPMIGIGPEIVDFIHPGYFMQRNGIPQIPFYRDALSGADERSPVFGHPVYAHASRFAGKRRFFDDPRLRSACADFVAKEGGEGFFQRKDWRPKLSDFAQTFRRDNPHPGRFETEEERDRALRFELTESKRLIESHLEGKQAGHFCNPWYIGSDLMARMARESGYSSMHLGVTVGFDSRASDAYPHFVLRLQEEYLISLPGEGSKGLFEVLKRKAASSSAYAA